MYMVLFKIIFYPVMMEVDDTLINLSLCTDRETFVYGLNLFLL